MQQWSLQLFLCVISAVALIYFFLQIDSASWIFHAHESKQRRVLAGLNPPKRAPLTESGNGSFPRRARNVATSTIKRIRNTTTSHLPGFLKVRLRRPKAQFFIFSIRVEIYIEFWY
jgi:hypothetical protein